MSAPKIARDFEALRAALPTFADGLYARVLDLHEQPSAEAGEQLLASLDGARILVARMVASIRAESLRSPGAAE